ncbi:hypothetical protein D3C81_2283530 [compost metagenome]
MAAPPSVVGCCVSYHCCTWATSAMGAAGGWAASMGASTAGSRLTGSEVRGKPATAGITL